MQSHPYISLGNKANSILTVIVSIEQVFVDNDAGIGRGVLRETPRSQSQTSRIDLTIYPKIILKEKKIIARKRIVAQQGFRFNHPGSPKLLTQNLNTANRRF